MRNKLKRISYDKNLELPQIIEKLNAKYLKETSHHLNIENPVSWTEKLQYLKLYDSTQIKADWTDKIKAKYLAADIIGEKYIVPILLKGIFSYEDIDFRKLPKRFVIKTNHGSGNIIVVKNKWLFLLFGQHIIAKRRLKYWMRIDYGYDDFFELHYSLIKPQIFIEPYIESFGYNYKEYNVYCFEGRPECISVKICLNGNKEHYRNVYSVDWKCLNVSWTYPRTKVDEKPAQLSKMLEFASKLSKGFHFVRVDFNVLDGRLFFGEMTFTSGSGYMKVKPHEYDVYLGSLINIP